MVIEHSLSKERELKISSVSLMLVLLAVLLGTFLRISLFALYPFVALIVLAGLQLRFTKYFFNLLILAGISLVLSFFGGFFLKYKMLSLFYMIPFLALLFSAPGEKRPGRSDLVKIFFKSLAIVAVINDIAGYIQFFGDRRSDDSFVGIYSNFSISLGGLSIINCTLFVYYYFNYLQYRTRMSLFWAIFFLISSLMAFYGAGLVVFIAAFVLTFLKPKVFSLLKILVICSISLWLGIKFLQYIKPNIVGYYKTNLLRILGRDQREFPRKLISFSNYANSYPANVKDFLFGSGPGTFNSRSAFIVGSPSYFTSISFFKSENQPYYFKNYAYTLWNESNTRQATFQDGFRNQPFSSLLAFLGEYGIIFTLFLAWYYYRLYKRIMAREPDYPLPLYRVYKRVLRFLYIFLPFLLLIDNFYEFPEIMLLIILIIKLLHISMNNMRVNETYD